MSDGLFRKITLAIDGDFSTEYSTKGVKFEMTRIGDELLIVDNKHRGFAYSISIDDPEYVELVKRAINEVVNTQVGMMETEGRERISDTYLRRLSSRLPVTADWVQEGF